MKKPLNRAFTIIELLVVVSIIALLVGILLPAIGKARDQAKVTISQANLRNLGTAHASYAAEWADRQLTLVVDNIASYGTDTAEAFAEYARLHGEDVIGSDAWHAPIYLGWGHGDDDFYYLYRYFQRPGQVANNSLTLPIVFESPANLQGFGSFRLGNCRQFNQYVSGRFYDKVFYAPKDKAVINSAAQCFESPDEYCTHADVATGLGDIPAWTSYVLSPAAMFNPEVMRHDDPNDDTANGWTSPWNLPGGFRSPSFSQTLYPNLKTHMLEHHWLQNAQADCNSTFEPGTYGGCEPYYFNHAWESSPITLFYDGHVEGIGVRRAMRADGRMRAQTGESNWGLWSKDTGLGEDGYFIDAGYDQAATSFHILTTDGIRGRDALGG
ncbi:MAG: type II secretion system protein [Phycisphaerales bacterium]|nr:type II secretion system GspH family protein [Phycisphaerae bacterium]NNM25680.1 type II secretion system protein [Phycisphaerales bacterium]